MEITHGIHPPEPKLMQMCQMPKNFDTNLNQFIQDKKKLVLLGKAITFVWHIQIFHQGFYAPLL